MRKVWPVVVLAPALLAGCALLPSFPSDETAVSPRLTVAMLRQAEFRRQAGADADELLQILAPSQGDMFGLGGSVLGEVAAGVPGGAALGFGGHVAGGNTMGKAVGSTLGGLLGAVLGPLGGIFGGVAGGYAGTQVHLAIADEPVRWDDPRPGYIEGLDTGPLIAASTAAPDKT